MKIDRTHAKAAFAAYVQPYDPQDSKIALKIAHTYRVAQLAETIADSQGFSQADASLAWLSGLLHDVGRFEQVRRYGTFNDAQSVDHALLGAKILFEEGRIRDYLSENDEDELLETAVRLHSAYRLPAQLGERTRTFCHILRDADKIDILRVNCETPMTQIYNVSEQDLKMAPISPAVMESFSRRQATLRSLKKTPADNIAGMASLVFELVYPSSIRIVREQGYLDQLLHFPTQNPATHTQLAQMRQLMEEYLSARVHG